MYGMKGDELSHLVCSRNNVGYTVFRMDCWVPWKEEQFLEEFRGLSGRLELDSRTLDAHKDDILFEAWLEAQPESLFTLC